LFPLVGLTHSTPPRSRMRMLSALFLWIPGVKHKHPEDSHHGYYEKL
jgi:hypothetical protein